MKQLDQHRFFLKDTLRKSVDFRQTDQRNGIPAPPLEKPFPTDSQRISLPDPKQWADHVSDKSIVSAISQRRSIRRFKDMDLSVEELSFLLWATQGINDPTGRNPSLRTVPSAGARHSFESYLFIMGVNDLTPGLYRFLPLENELLFISTISNMKDELSMACLGQSFAATGAVTFAWTTIPYRMEWRYSLSAHRVILMDVGHVCQNLYLACQAINCGTCALGAYDQEKIDELLGVDGQEEFTIYLAPVGKV